MKEIYLDHASTTYTDNEVLKEMLPYFTEKYGNPESLHKKGQEALMATDKARESIANILNCRLSEIYFCGTATASNNLAIFGIANTYKDRGNHLLTTKIEHPSILQPFQKLEKDGYDVTYLDVNSEGLIDPKALEAAIKKETIFVSIMYANNEIGTIQNIKELGKVCRKHEVPFHTDACQAGCSKTLDTKELNVDLMTINGSKIYGPKGVGVLYANRDIKLTPVIYGGGQESGLRSGTHNIPNIMGIAKALELAQENREKENERLSKLRDTILEELKKIDGIKINGSLLHRLPNNINIQIKDVNNQELLLHLSEAGIYVSAGSACSAGKTTPSHVLKAIGLSDEEVTNSLRITMGKRTTEEDLDYTLEKLKELILKLRKHSKL